jgi:hypothetical protein
LLPSSGRLSEPMHPAVRQASCCVSIPEKVIWLTLVQLLVWQRELHAQAGHFGERHLVQTGRLALTNPPAGQTWRLYYYTPSVSSGQAPGQRVAMRQRVGTSSVVYYLVSDHLGSTSLALDINRNIVAESRYYPYGDVLAVSGTLPTDHQFTGQLQNRGLDFMTTGRADTTLVLTGSSRRTRSCLGRGTRRH